MRRQNKYPEKDEISKLEYLAAENNSLRQEMKMMNQAVNTLIDQVKDEKQRKREKPVLKKLDYEQSVIAKNK